MRNAGRRRLAAAIGALAAGLMAAFTIPASATPPSTTSAYVLLAESAPTVAKNLWIGGHFEVTGAPILPEDPAPDGWLCHLLISCRPAVLAAAGLSDDDPTPIAETQEQAVVSVECKFGLGNWFKIHFSRPGSSIRSVGWVAADAVDIADSGRRVYQCAAFFDW